MSCGNETTTNKTEEGTDTPAATTTGSETTTPATTTTTSDATGKITDAVVQKACDCQEGARKEDGTIDFPKVGECMGGKNKIQYVADLLGSGATKKEQSDAEKALTEKMNVKCPK